jgi:hypothetical protein
MDERNLPIQTTSLKPQIPDRYSAYSKSSNGDDSDSKSNHFYTPSDHILAQEDNILSPDNPGLEIKINTGDINLLDGIDSGSQGSGFAHPKSGQNSQSFLSLIGENKTRAQAKRNSEINRQLWLVANFRRASQDSTSRARDQVEQSVSQSRERSINSGYKGMSRWISSGKRGLKSGTTRDSSNSRVPGLNSHRLGTKDSTGPIYNPFRNVHNSRATSSGALDDERFETFAGIPEKAEVVGLRVVQTEKAHLAKLSLNEIRKNPAKEAFRSISSRKYNDKSGIVSEWEDDCDNPFAYLAENERPDGTPKKKQVVAVRMPENYSMKKRADIWKNGH